AQMDAAVLAAYGWTDLLPKCACEFLLDYEDEDDESEAGLATNEGKSRKRKKPWRLRWTDEIRDEVLARLLSNSTPSATCKKNSPAKRRQRPSPRNHAARSLRPRPRK